MRVVEYDPSRRRAIADLMGRVWGARPDERELAWLYEENPVRPASVLLAEEDRTCIATVAIAFARMRIAGEALEVGMPLRVATDPAYRGRGIFRRLEAENEERARRLGVRLLLTVPNAASTPVFLERLGWHRLPPLRIWGRFRLRPRSLRGARLVERLGDVPAPGGTEDRVLRDTDWLDWRFARAPRPYRMLEGEGYAVTGQRGRIGVLACVEGDLVRQASAIAEGRMIVAAPPPWRRGSYARAGYLPTRRTLTLLGKSLDPGQRVPGAPHLELGDLDFL